MSRDSALSYTNYNDTTGGLNLNRKNHFNCTNSIDTIQRTQSVGTICCNKTLSYTNFSDKALRDTISRDLIFSYTNFNDKTLKT